MLLSMVFSHTVLQYSHIKQHLYPVILFRLYLVTYGILISFSGFHFYETTHIPLHIVQTPLYAQCFTDVRRFKYRILFIQIISGIMKSIGHYFTDMLKMQLTIIKELLFFYLILQVLTSGNLYRIPLKRFLHARKVIHLSIRVNPFVQEKIHYISQ